MMNILSFLSAIALTIYVFFAFHVIGLRRDWRPERFVFAAFSLLYAAWSGMYAFMSSTESEATAWILIRVFAFSWTLSASAFLHFALLHSNAVRSRNLPAQLAIYLPGLVFAVKGTIGPLFFDELTRTNGLWVEVNTSPSLWPIAYFIFYYASIFTGLIVIGARAKRSTILRERRQARVIIVGYLATAVLVAVGTVLQPLFGVNFPRIPHLFTLLWVASIWYAIDRYKLLGDTVADSAANPTWKLFTPREQEIGALLVQGESYRVVGERLHISHHTVKSHVERIYAKAEVNNKAQLLLAVGAVSLPGPEPDIS